MLKIEYIKPLKQWQAAYFDDLGQLGLAMLAESREQAVFLLGLQIGRRPDEFSRPLGDYFKF